MSQLIKSSETYKFEVKPLTCYFKAVTAYIDATGCFHYTFHDECSINQTSVSILIWNNYPKTLKIDLDSVFEDICKHSLERSYKTSPKSGPTEKPPPVNGSPQTMAEKFAEAAKAFSKAIY